jgi:hypothetical protein
VGARRVGASRRRGDHERGPIKIGGGFEGVDLTCASATECYVVGSTGSGSSFRPAVVPISKGVPQKVLTWNVTDLEGIGCASSSVCFAVGLNSSGGVVERF